MSLLLSDQGEESGSCSHRMSPVTAKISVPLARPVFFEVLREIALAKLVAPP